MEPVLPALLLPVLRQVAERIAAGFAADWPSALLVAGSVVALFGAGEILRRFAKLPVEYTRKFAHVGAGFVVIAFPWMFSSVWTVSVLAFAFFGVLVIGRLTGQLDSVHGVRRRTSGAYYYPFAVLGTFWLSGGDPVLYCAPIAVMALADTGAAIVGTRGGRHRYRVYDGHRSLEGSVTFFGLAFAVLLVALAVAGRPGWPALLLVTLVAATLATATEALSVRGADNVFVPYAVYLVLERTLRLGLADLSGWIGGMLLGLGLVVLHARLARLRPAGGIALFVVGTLAWALGGARWTVPLLALDAAVVGVSALGRAPLDLDLDEVVPTVVGSLVLVLAFAHTSASELYLPYLATLGANGAIALARIAAGRRLPLAPLALLGAGAPLLPALGAAGPTGILAVAGASLGGLALFALLRRTPLVGRRLWASLAAGAAAWLVLVAPAG